MSCSLLNQFAKSECFSGIGLTVYLNWCPKCNQKCSQCNDFTLIQDR